MEGRDTSHPPEAWEPARRLWLALARPLDSFLHVEASSGILLLVMAIIAMIWANSPLRESYAALWHTELHVGIGAHTVSKDLHFWINDGLMVVFFFVVGLEIRREMHGGELSNVRRAALPVAAALGGMIAPALIYLALNRDPALAHGWGVPTATDIAFAVGVLALLGKRVPSALRVLLLALAIIDDIGAILVIAFFYSTKVSLVGLGVAAMGVAFVLVLQRIGVRRPWLYVLPGVVVWYGVLTAGVHPTIAGVILGLLTPARSWYGREGFLSAAGGVLAEVESAGPKAPKDLLEPLERLRLARKEAVAPALRLEAALHPYVAFGVMPLFALSNAGVTLGAADLGGDGLGVVLGIGLGLVLGKPLGIVLTSVLAYKVGIATLPRGVDVRGLAVVGAVAGIGFTMAIFIAQLAFADARLLGLAKLAVLAGSVSAGALGALLGLLLLPRQSDVSHVSVEQAERSTRF